MGKKKSILDLRNMKREGVKLICRASHGYPTAAFAEHNMDPFPGHYRCWSSFSWDILQAPETTLHKALAPFQTTLKAQADLGCNVLQTKTVGSAQVDLSPFCQTLFSFPAPSQIIKVAPLFVGQFVNSSLLGGTSYATF